MIRSLRKPTHYVARTTLTGAFLALGAPIGYVLYSFLFLNSEHLGFIGWCSDIVADQPVLFTYLTFPTLIVFSLFGFCTGLQGERLNFKTRQMEHFLEIAAHDIRSPLAVIAECANLIKEKTMGPLTPEQDRFVGIIQRQSSTMSELVTEILDIHKMEEGYYQLDLKPTPLLPIIRKSVEEMNAMIEKKFGQLNIESKLPDDTVVNLDSFRIRQVFRNLIGNAIKFMPDKGAIDIRVFKKSKSDIEITLTNIGRHIPEDKISTIFDKFTQANTRDYKLGYGLGLSICKNIMDLHDGGIWAENVMPEGVRIHLCLKGIP